MPHFLVRNPRPVTTATENTFSINAKAMVGPAVVIGEVSIPAIAATMPDNPYESMMVGSQTGVVCDGITATAIR